MTLGGWIPIKYILCPTPTCPPDFIHMGVVQALHPPLLHCRMLLSYVTVFIEHWNVSLLLPPISPPPVLLQEIYDHVVKLYSVETELVQLLASQEHPTEDPALTRSILTLNKNHEDTQERYQGGRGEGRGKRGERKLENVQE